MGFEDHPGFPEVGNQIGKAANQALRMRPDDSTGDEQDDVSQRKLQSSPNL